MGYFSIIFFLFFIHSTIAQQCDILSNNERFDCYPNDDADEQKCQARGCCWRKPDDAFEDINVPFCYYPKDFPSYILKTNQSTDFGQRIVINKSQDGFMPNDTSELTVDLIYESNQRLRIRIYNSAQKRYEVPLEVPVIPIRANRTDYDVKMNEKPFSIVVTRVSTGVVLFDSSVSPLIFADQFIRLSTRLSSPLVYGLGEHRQGLVMNITNQWKKLTFWTRDFPPVENINLYGVHAFHINPEFDQNGTTHFHGQFLLNSNAMDVDLQPLPALTYTTIGGIIDLYIFTGSTVQDVIEQYWDIVGKPTMPPYWALGFHLCRFGYNNISNMMDVIRRMDRAGFPYDVQWTDIDAMSKHLDFTYDEVNFDRLPDLVRLLQTSGKHYVNIIDPAISSTQTPGEYPPYDDGIEQGIFIKKFNSTDLIIGEVWPGQTVFPDFTHPNATEWWTKAVEKFHSIVPFDGMWIDMNEPSNFRDGSIDGCSKSPLDTPPFTPDVLGNNLNSKTLCPSAQQYLSSHYNLHNMYGYFEAKASNAALKEVRKKRPFVLSRSSFAGSGQFTAHWTGDNRATFSDMYFSIPAIMNFNMFGIPLVGADICGFGLDTTEQLCTRWMQLGAFYPFMRNHNDLGQRDQDPAAFSWEAQQIMKDALLIRYSLIPFWYTLHYEASTSSRTVIQPLFFEYPDDYTTYNIDQQFLIGRTLLVSPNLHQDSEIVHAYIPTDVWYEFPSGVRFQPIGTFVDLPAPLTKINVHLRGGFIIPMKIPGENLIMGRANPFTLLVAPSNSGTANGNLFWDDGDSIDITSYNYLTFASTETELNITVTERKNSAATMRLEIVKILGVNKTVDHVTINGEYWSNFLYNSLDKILLLYGLDLNMLDNDHQIIQWFFI